MVMKDMQRSAWPRVEERVYRQADMALLVEACQRARETLLRGFPEA